MPIRGTQVGLPFFRSLARASSDCSRGRTTCKAARTTESRQRSNDERQTTDSKQQTANAYSATLVGLPIAGGPSNMIEMGQMKLQLRPLAQLTPSAGSAERKTSSGAPMRTTMSFLSHMQNGFLVGEAPRLKTGALLPASWPRLECLNESHGRARDCAPAR